MQRATRVIDFDERHVLVFTSIIQEFSNCMDTTGLIVQLLWTQYDEQEVIVPAI